MEKIKAPKGFLFKIERLSVNATRVWLYKKEPFKRDVGRVTLIRKYDNFYQTHSWLEESLRNQGLGTLLYARAIQYGLDKGWRVSSSGQSSMMAKRVWQGRTLRKYFSIKFKKHHHDSYFDKWYAYIR